MRNQTFIILSLLLIMLGGLVTIPYAEAKVSPLAIWLHQGDYTLLWWAKWQPHILTAMTSKGDKTLSSGVRGGDNRQRAEAIVQGGVGYPPVIFTGLSQPQGYHLYFNGVPLNQSVRGNDFWQTDYDSSTKTLRRTYNIPAGSGGKETIMFKLDK